MNEDSRIEVNVEEIMREIRIKAQMEEDLENLPAFEDIPIQAEGVEADAAARGSQLDLAGIEDSLQYINVSYDIPYYWSFGPAGIKTFVKRVVRKLLKCLIPPILEKQNRFNAHVVNCLNALRTLFTRTNTQADEIASLKRELSAYREETEKRIKSLQTIYAEETAEQIKALRERLTEESTGQINALRKILTEETTSQINALREMQQKRFNEFYSMVALNESSISALKGDMDCIKKVDASIFGHEYDVYFSKYAQSGEDGIVANIFRRLAIRPEHVTYLDLGANHAREMSNTYYFYQSGASGVLVEANPNLLPELKLLRSRDIVLNNCISSIDDNVVDFYVMNIDGLSTGSKLSVDENSSIDPQLKVSETVQVKTISVNTILEQYFSQSPLLLSIDIEGNEMDVLASLDFEKYRPVVIIVETIPYEPNLVIGKKNHEVISYLQDKGYTEYAFTGINSIFVDEEQIKNGPYKGVPAAGIDYIHDMKTNELTSKSSNGICVKPNGIVYGPYIVCRAGEYRLEVKAVLLDSGCPTYLDVTAESGIKNIAQFVLKNGINYLYFSLEREEKEVEFVLRNRTSDNMYLAMVSLQRER